jgi:hypothetical protein
MPNFVEISVSQFVRFAEEHSRRYGYRRVVQQSRRDFFKNAIALLATLCTLPIFQ